ncbi:hypothetical protein KSF_073000 [Reticulibacter mediterranei]|uniref:Uncharacterized protein n=1 Tax=Reticulibacter mediterranei TaxID=2778369 RepID=A0A8J3N3N7_9CHLR|nr:hypothetical protein [Reticulibacter mediterranei]GHO97252.1 hypothetical protein KSF_073000 [Reticulibacter mediterranei]
MTLAPFQQGQDLARRLILLGVLSGWPITDRIEAHEVAMCYARYVAPCANPETVRTIAAGLLFRWTLYAAGRVRM